MKNSQIEKDRIHISVCTGTNCSFRGASQLVEALRAEKDIQEYCVISEMSCPNSVCDHSRRSPVVKINDDYILEAKLEAIMDNVYTHIRNEQEASS
ncbi:MAG: NAD(P)H-dependent oxidoreductase subunit E [Sphaerochaeta sp.]